MHMISELKDNWIASGHLFVHVEKYGFRTTIHNHRVIDGRTIFTAMSVCTSSNTTTVSFGAALYDRLHRHATMRLGQIL